MTADLNESINISLGNGLSPVAFPNPDAFMQWIENEWQFWQWLQIEANRDGTFAPCWREIERLHNRANEIVAPYKAEPNPQRKRQILDSLQADVSSIYGGGRILPSSSSRAQYVDRLKTTDPVIAASALLSFLPQIGQPLNLSLSYARKGAVLAILFDEGISSSSAVAEKNALGLLHQEWSKSLEDGKTVSEDAKRLLAETNREIENTKTALGVLRGEQAGELKSQRDSQSQQFDKLLESTGKRFDEITKAYDEKLALLAPVQYWENKARSHAWGIGWSASLWAISALGAAGLIWIEADKMGLLAPPPNGGRGVVDYIHYALIFATGSLLLWPLRVLARIFFSSLHLREDAKERVTMAKVYLSLLRSDQALSTDDRKLILESLFRPTSKGFVDDASPMSVMQVASRLASGDKNK